MESQCKSLVHSFLNLGSRDIWSSQSTGGGGGSPWRVFRNPVVCQNSVSTQVYFPGPLFIRELLCDLPDFLFGCFQLIPQTTLGQPVP